MTSEKKFKVGISRDQDVLIPRRIEEYVGENHIVKLIVDISRMLKRVNEFQKNQIFETKFVSSISKFP